jgi:signal peptidase II
MPTRPTHKYIIAGIIALAVVILDQYTKYLIAQHLPLHHSLPIIEPYLTILHTRNKGIAFGLFSGQVSTTQTVLLILTSLAAIVFIFYLLSGLGKQFLYATVTLALILGGAIGNLIDRIRWGEVIDFIDLHWHGYHWPAFNCADSAISVGLVLLVIGMFTKRFPLR